MVDTKYEFGLGDDGNIYLIDEIHTPDSSRYFYANSYDRYIGGDKTVTPKHLSKEFVREWLLARGFQGQQGQTLPEITEEFVQQTSERYIELYEEMTGQTFNKAATNNVMQRIETNVNTYLESTL